MADEQGVVAVGLEQDAVGFTSFELYARHNPDGDDIAEGVEGAWAEIRAGELAVPETIERYLAELAPPSEPAP